MHDSTIRLDEMQDPICSWWDVQDRAGLGTTSSSPMLPHYLSYTSHALSQGTTWDQSYPKWVDGTLKCTVLCADFISDDMYHIRAKSSERSSSQYLSNNVATNYSSALNLY